MIRGLLSVSKNNQTSKMRRPKRHSPMKNYPQKMRTYKEKKLEMRKTNYSPKKRTER